MPGFEHCNWCYGKGCMCCDAERKKWEEARDREYERRFPNGPEPIFTARLDNPDDMEALKRIVGRDVLVQAFSKDGDGAGGKVDRLTRDLVHMLAPDKDAADHVIRQFRGIDAIEKRAEIERFMQRHRPDGPVEPEPDGKTLGPDCDHYGNPIED